nr:glycosyltransferase family 4 protein [Bacteroides sp.]
MTEPNTVYGLFNDSFPPALDGVTLTVQNYVKWLTAKGKKVCVVTPWDPYDPPHPDFEMHRYFSLPIYNRHPYRYGYPRLDPVIWHKIRRVPFRIVHAHCPFSSGRLARYAAQKHDVPLVATFHSKYRTDLEHSLPAPMIRYQMKRIREFYNSADALWIPQAAVEETVREYGITAPVTVVDNGNDFNQGGMPLESVREEARRRLGIPRGRFVLLFVGQHILQKGIEIIIDSLPLLPERIDWEMHFVGNGYARQDMMRKVRLMGLDDKVTFHGLVHERDELRDIYAASDLFLFPSFYDNAPLVVREAAMMGTPAVLLEGSTAAEVITHGENGFLTGRTPQEYAVAVTRLHDDPDMLTRIADGARRTLSRSWDNVMEEVMQRYDDIIARYEFRHKK